MANRRWSTQGIVTPRTRPQQLLRARFAALDAGKRVIMARLAHPPRHTAAALGVAFLIYLIAGHAYHPGKAMGEAAMGSGICIVLVTVLAAVTLARPVRPSVPFALFVDATPAPLPHSVRAPMPRARSSPVWLQRFLN